MEPPLAVTPTEEELARFITIQRGDLPIILSAPHGGSDRIPGVPDRQGKGVARFVTVRDSNTAALAERLAVAIEREMGGRPYVVIARFSRAQIDANRAAAAAWESPAAAPYYDAYHEALAGFCAEVEERFGAGLLLDIHGQALRSDTLFRGTRNHRTVASLVERHGVEAVIGPSSLLGAFAARGHAVYPDPAGDPAAEEHGSFTGGHIVAAHGSADGGTIDAIQLEFGGRYRARRALSKTAADLAAAVRVFCEAYLPATSDAPATRPTTREAA